LYYKIIGCFIFFTLLTNYSNLCAQTKNDNFSGMVTSYSSSTKTSPSVYYENLDSKDIKVGERVNNGCTLITLENQTLEVTIYKNRTPVGMLFLSENADVTITSSENNIDFFSNYGRFRLVFQKNSQVTVSTKKIRAEVTGTDFGFQSTVNNNVKEGYFLIFEGSIKVYTVNSPKDFKPVSLGESIKFKDGVLLDKINFDQEELDFWKKNLIFKTKIIPNNVNLALEKFVFGKKEVLVKASQTDSTSDSNQVNNDATDDETKKEAQALKIIEFLEPVISFELGGFAYNFNLNNYTTNVGIKTVFDPSFKYFNDKFEFGFYINVNFYPGALTTGDAWSFLGTVNCNNRWINKEWSFGSDKTDNSAKVVFDVFDDILIKSKIIRYGKSTDPIFIQLGDNNEVRDYSDFLLYDYNPDYFKLFQRKVSFVSQFELSWLNAFIYAEDIMPKGIYGGTIQFKTTPKSFNFKFILTSFVDCYSLVQFNNETWTMPAHFSSSFAFEAFNLPSFGLSFYINGGLNIPFSSLMVSNYAQIVSSGMIFSFATNIRLQDFSLGFEFVKDSAFARIAEFDLSYNFNRDNKILNIKNWYSGLSGRTTDNDYFKDHFFGGRLRTHYNYLKHVYIDLFYQIGAAFTLSTMTVSGFTVPIPNYSSLYDKASFKLTLDSLDKWRFKCKFYAMWNVDNMINSIIANTFLNSNLIFAGFIINPFDSIDIKFQGGMYPFSSQTSFVFDISVVVKPMKFVKPKSQMQKAEVEEKAEAETENKADPETAQ